MCEDMTSSSSTVESPPRWQGINHVALVTTDMDATVRFYHGVLGARLVATVGTEQLRHYFFALGAHCTVAFFEFAQPAAEPFVKVAGVPDSQAAQFDHLALNLPDEDALLALRRRLVDAAWAVSEMVDHGIGRSIYFTDPNGIALEASYWVHDPTQGKADHRDARFFSDRQPVPAVQELARAGELQPTAALVPSP